MILMCPSSHIRHVSNLEIELCLLFSDWEKVTGEIQIETDNPCPKKPTSHFYYDSLPKQ